MTSEEEDQAWGRFGRFLIWYALMWLYYLIRHPIYTIKNTIKGIRREFGW